MWGFQRLAYGGGKSNKGLKSAGVMRIGDWDCNYKGEVLGFIGCKKGKMKILFDYQKMVRKLK